MVNVRWMREVRSMRGMRRTDLHRTPSPPHPHNHTYALQYENTRPPPFFISIPISLKLQKTLRIYIYARPPAPKLSEKMYTTVGCTIGCITFGFFLNKKNRNSSCGSPEHNMEPKNFLYFFGRVPSLRWGSESTYLSKV